MIQVWDTSKLRRAGVGAFFRPRDVAPFGISHRKLQGWVAEGRVENIGNGLYRLSDVAPTESESIAMVAAAIPNVVVCLLTALRYYDIGTQSPHEVWIALDRKRRKPAHPPCRVRIVRFSGRMLTYGVLQHSALGVPFRITSPARTVVDCFRYRKKFGLDMALEALDDVSRSGIASIGEIERAAEVCRVSTVMRPYLEARGL
ncbi:MAG: transcriptional regulator [Gammaproteobacteria bacterium]|nr:transcriptional regulator [Gammaproteobacteria bacterium]MYL01300.1 transcriptional regulator [Gammaproteobacteria bacterium]